jgi:hypothetical protein
VPGSRESSCACACSVGTSSSRFLAYRSAPQKPFHRREVKTATGRRAAWPAQGWRSIQAPCTCVNRAGVRRLPPHEQRTSSPADAAGVHRFLLKLWITTRFRPSAPTTLGRPCGTTHGGERLQRTRPVRRGATAPLPGATPDRAISRHSVSGPLHPSAPPAAWPASAYRSVPHEKWPPVPARPAASPPSARLDHTASPEFGARTPPMPHAGLDGMPRPPGRAPPGSRGEPLRNRVSPFSTEKLVYAALAFQCSTRFQQVWMSLWKTDASCLQSTGLRLQEQTLPGSLQQENRWTFRASVTSHPVENDPRCDYNDGGFRHVRSRSSRKARLADNHLCTTLEQPAGGAVLRR